MRSGSLALSLVLGCGRVGFDVCASGCGGNGGSRIERLAVATPGSMDADHQAVPFPLVKDSLVLLAVYTTTTTIGVISDDLGETWQSLPEEAASDGNFSGRVRFYYTVATHTGADVIHVDAPGFARQGCFVVSYSGVAAFPVDTSAGRSSAPGAPTFDLGPLETNDDDLLVTVYIALQGGFAINPGAGARRLAQDNVFSALLQDQPAPAGSHTVTASPERPATTWAASSVALLPR